MHCLVRACVEMTQMAKGGRGVLSAVHVSGTGGRGIVGMQEKAMGVQTNMLGVAGACCLGGGASLGAFVRFIQSWVLWSAGEGVVVILCDSRAVWWWCDIPVEPEGWNGGEGESRV